MRKMRRVFWDALLSLGLSWGIARYLNPTDLEAQLFLAIGMSTLCLIIILPIALHSLPHNKPWTAALSLPFMLSPLILLFSRPALYFTPFSFLWSRQEELLTPWALNGLLNSIIFIIAGYLIARPTPEQKPISWPKALFATITIAVLYAGIVYLSSWLY